MLASLAFRRNGPGTCSPLPKPRHVRPWVSGQDELLRRHQDLAFEPRIVQSYLELARVLEEAGRLEESVEPLLAAAKLDNRPALYLRVASILERLDRPDESKRAREAYEWLRLEEMARRRRR
jgi:tetratricopeptide (TPR) repeat protein